MPGQIFSIHKIRTRKAMIVVFALWTLSILAIFALSISAGIRQKIMLVKRLDTRERLHFITRAGVQVARAVLYNDRREFGKQKFETALRKKNKMNNSDMFKAMGVNGGFVTVSYIDYDTDINNPTKFYGLQDELGKLNINVASRVEMIRLFRIVVGLSEDAALDLANAILDWRSHADQTILGFYGDEYYASLNFPYEAKKGPFEVLEEVRLVKGMNPEVWRRVRDFITVYGDGYVNINTASRAVLTALGLSTDVIHFIMKTRNGPDEIPGTDDDFVFRDDGVSIYLGPFFELLPEQLAQIDYLYVQQRICTVSQIYRIDARGQINEKETYFINCVVHAGDDRILSWREGFDLI